MLYTPDVIVDDQQLMNPPDFECVQAAVFDSRLPAKTADPKFVEIVSMMGQISEQVGWDIVEVSHTLGCPSSDHDFWLEKSEPADLARPRTVVGFLLDQVRLPQKATEIEESIREARSRLSFILSVECLEKVATKVDLAREVMAGENTLFNMDSLKPNDYLVLGQYGSARTEMIERIRLVMSELGKTLTRHYDY